MAEHGCYLVPTLVAYDQLAKYGEALNFPAESLRKLHDVSGAGLSAIDTAAQAGVKIGFGTDLLGERHDAQSEEFALRAQVLSNAEIIRSATCVNAELIGMRDTLGVLEPSAYADLLVIDGNPLSDLSLLAGQGERIKLIVRGGEIIKNELL
jgi:imidazolonepropionase-like amidohydrolase